MILDYMVNHYNDILAIIGGIVSVATIITKLTPSTKDDEILTKIVNIISKFSVINTKNDQEIINGGKK